MAFFFNQAIVGLRGDATFLTEDFYGTAERHALILDECPKWGEGFVMFHNSDS